MKQVLRSFDIFDTVLTRAYAVPGDLFVALGESGRRQGLIKIEAREFALKRMAAETAARQTAPAHEPGLSDIYTLLAIELGLAPAESDRLRELELELEADALQPVPGMRERVQAAREASGQVLFISDMYLPASFLERVLMRARLFRSGDRIYVSGEAKASKAAGSLYSRIRSDLSAGEVEWVHVGDNQRADDSVPRTLGILTTPVTCTRLNRYELLARGEGPAAPLWRSRLAAAMRLARLEGADLAHAQRVIWSTGADVVGPLLFGFVCWCVRQAEERGIQRLYFIARDGQVLQKIGELICAGWGLRVECRYLYGSRQAWRIPALGGVGAEELEWAAPRDHGLSVEHVCARLGLEPRQLEPWLRERGFPAAGWREPLSEERLQALRQILVLGPVQQLVKETAQRARPLLIHYLEQAGLFDGVPFGLVDIGWGGNLQRSLGRSLSLAGHPEAARLTGFYFGLRPRTPVPEGQVMLDYSSQLAGPRPGWTPQSVSMFEMFAAADHGSVTGYAMRGEGVVPTLAEAENSAALAWGLRSLQSGICAFARGFLGIAGEARPPLAELQSVTQRIFELFYHRPERAEAEVWGAFPLKGQAIENIRGQVVPKWGTGQMLAALLDYRKRPDGWWMEGTLAARPSLGLWLFLKLRAAREQLKRG